MSRTSRRSPIRPAAARPAGVFALHTPLLPVEALTALTAPSEAAERSGVDEADRRRAVRARLRELIAQPAVAEAILVTSAGLTAGVAIWRRDPESRRGQQIERALYGLVARMAGQPAPDGLLAGSSLGAIADVTELTLEDRAAYRRRSRLDIGLLARLAAQLANRRELRAQLAYRVNPSLYRAAGKVQIVAAQPGAPGGGFRVVAADATPYLDATLARAEQGARLAALAEALVGDDPDIALDDARGFVHELVDAQFLISPLAPALTGDDPVVAFVAELQGYRGVDDVAAPLGEAQQALTALEREPLGAPLEHHRAIARTLDGLSVPGAPAYRVELRKASPRATLGRRVITEVLRGVEILRRLAEPSPAMRSFVEAFAMRYGDAEVSLLEALDEDIGIGFGASPGSTADAPLLHNLAFPGAEPAARFASRDARLLRRIEDARRAGDTVLALSLDDLAQLSQREPVPLPRSFAVTARIAAPSHDALARGNFRVIVECVRGPSGGNALAGLAAGDPALRAQLAEYLRGEEASDPGAVFAEIVHLPGASAAHAVVRPVLRSHEIVYLGRSGAPEAAQIPASDLTISLGRDEQIVLGSRRLGREIIPRLTAPHHDLEPSAPAAYRLLCALAAQGAAAELRFSWGALEALGFLPRVQVGRVVLARARWRLFAEQLRELVAPGAARFAAMQRLRDRLTLPGRVELDAGDHRVLLDLDQPLCVDILAAQARRRGEVRLFEIYPSLDELCAAGPEGRFVSELVIPFVRDAAPRPRPPRRAPRRPVVADFAPGTEWLQVNLYTARRTADDVLRALVAPQMASAMSRAVSDRWFFVRYSQPDWHVRLHIHGEPTTLRTTVLPALHAAAAGLLDDGRLWKLQLDTYRREVERYGGPDAIEIAEAMFHADSEAVVGIVDLLDGDAGEHARWRLCLCGIDLLLGDLGLSLADKLALMQRARAGLARSLGVDRRVEHQLSARYRRERGALEALLAPSHDVDGELAPAIALLHERSQKLAPWLRQLAAHARDGRLSQPIDELARSHVHMFANRLLRSAALAQELVLYDWLRRLYESQLARRSV